jgi:hypothetical protein
MTKTYRISPWINTNMTTASCCEVATCSNNFTCPAGYMRKISQYQSTNVSLATCCQACPANCRYCSTQTTMTTTLKATIVSGYSFFSNGLWHYTNSLYYGNTSSVEACAAACNTLNGCIAFARNRYPWSYYYQDGGSCMVVVGMAWALSNSLMLTRHTLRPSTAPILQRQHRQL